MPQSRTEPRAYLRLTPTCERASRQLDCDDMGRSKAASAHLACAEHNEGDVDERAAHASDSVVSDLDASPARGGGGGRTQSSS